MNQCLLCKTDTVNPKFCSRSCAVTMNNKVQAKRKLKGTCSKCSTAIRSSRKFCKSCKELRRSIRTIGDFRNRISLMGKHQSWLHSEVRSLNREVNKHMLKWSCMFCGYKLHVELAHIRPLSSFSDDALISEVNSQQNLLALCPNCHWEFDHDILKLEDIKRPHQELHPISPT